MTYLAIVAGGRVGCGFANSRVVIMTGYACRYTEVHGVVVKKCRCKRKRAVTAVTGEIRLDVICIFTNSNDAVMTALAGS